MSRMAEKVGHSCESLFGPQTSAHVAQLNLQSPMVVLNPCGTSQWNEMPMNVVPIVAKVAPLEDSHNSESFA